MTYHSYDKLNVLCMTMMTMPVLYVIGFIIAAGAVKYNAPFTWCSLHASYLDNVIIINIQLKYVIHA